MNDRIYALFGVIGPLSAYFSIGVSIVLSPWFSWQKNALSDLGNASKSGVAPIFNFGLLLAGFLLALYAVKSMNKYAKRTSYSVLVSAFALQLVAAFNEAYGQLHLIVSYLFFISIASVVILYAVERKSILAAAALIVGLSSCMVYWARIYSLGIAVPETISSICFFFDNILCTQYLHKEINRA